MTKPTLILVLILTALFSNGQVKTPPVGGKKKASVSAEKPLWIVSEKPDSTQSGSWHCFRKAFTLNNIPTSVIAQIAVDSKYWMWINDSLIMYEGGQKRGPNPHDTYFDELDLAKHLKKGKNTISILVWYWGRHGFSQNSSGRCGLWFNSMAGNVSLNSNKSWRAIPNPAYSSGNRPNPNFRLSEPNIAYDARKEITGWQLSSFNDISWPAAIEIGEVPAKPWNKLVKRSIPFFKDYGVKQYTSIIKKGDTIICKLPYNGQFSPKLRVKASAGKKIFIATDTYYMGAFNLNLGALNIKDSLYTLCSDYITRNGEQEYESFGWLSGHEIRYVIPSGVEVINLSYHETGYNTKFAGSFECNDTVLNLLWKKAQRSVYVNMRDNYSDCPDRERAQWTGDAAMEMEQSFYAFDSSAWLLGRKIFLDLVNWQRADSTIMCPIPENDPKWKNELPVHSLMPLYDSWKYFTYTKDTSLLRYIYEPVKKYLSVWKFNKNGSLVYRPGGWDWGDWGDNIDFVLIQNGWYLLTCQTMVKIADLIGKTEDAKKYREIITKMKAYLNSVDCWNGNEYRHKDYKKLTDDRANSLMVMAGVADSIKYEKISNVFKVQFHSSPWMEKFVLESLIKMGRYDQSLTRMKKRFSEMANSKFSTLWEIWDYDLTPGSEHGHSGYNHGWSGGPLVLLSQYYAGISPMEDDLNSYKIESHLSGLKWIKTKFPARNGIMDLSLSNTKSNFSLDISIPKKTIAQVFIPVSGKNFSIECNGSLLVKNGSVSKQLNNVKLVSISEKGAYFQVLEGKFSFLETY